MVVMLRAVVCLSLLFCVCQIRGSHISVNMNKTIHNLLQHYKISAKERFNGKPVFSREPLEGKIEAKMMFMGGVLETYEKLIGEMLKQLPTPSPQTAGNNDRPASDVTPAAGTAAGTGNDVKTELNYILGKVRDLKKYRYLEQEKVLKRLQDLRHIQMDNFVVQSKALSELPWLYQEASSLPENVEQRRRRRRQARKFKTHARA